MKYGCGFLGVIFWLEIQHLALVVSSRSLHLGSMSDDAAETAHGGTNGEGGKGGKAAVPWRSPRGLVAGPDIRFLHSIEVESRPALPQPLIKGNGKGKWGPMSEILVSHVDTAGVRTDVLSADIPGRISVPIHWAGASGDEICSWQTHVDSHRVHGGRDVSIDFQAHTSEDEFGVDVVATRLQFSGFSPY